MYNMDHVNFVAGLTSWWWYATRVAVIVHACGILIMATCVTFRIMSNTNFQKQSTSLSCSDPL